MSVDASPDGLQAGSRDPGPDRVEARPDVSGAELVPGWLRGLAAIGWRVLAAVALGYVLLQMAIVLVTVVASVIVALIVTATFAPLVRRLRVERGWAPTKAAAVTSVIGLLFVLAAAAVVVIAFVPSIVDLLRAGQAGLDQLTAELATLGLPPAILEVVTNLVGSVRDWVLAAIAQVVGPIASAATVLILGGFLTFFLLQSGDRAWDKLTGELEGWRAQALTARGLVALDRIGAFLRTTAVLAAIDAATQWLFLTILGVPLAGPLAVLVFLGGFAPYLGAIVTTTVLALVALASGGPMTAAVLVALIAAVSVAEELFLVPRLYQGTERPSPPLALLAVPAGAAVGGLLGIVAAVPVAVLIEVLGPAVLDALDTSPQPTRSHTLVPTWLDRLGQWSWRALIALGLGWVVIQAVVLVPGVTVPVVLAAVLAASLGPAVVALERRGMGRTSASLTVTALSLVIVFGTLALTVASIASSLPEMVDEAVAGAQNLDLGPTPLQLVQAVGNGAVTNLGALVRNVASIGVLAVLAIILTFFFLRDGALWWDRALEHVPANRRSALHRTGGDAAGILSRYMVGTGLISAFGAITQAVIMWVLGLPLVVPIAVLSFFGGFIPYIGGFITTGLAFLVAVAVGDPRTILIMAIWTVVFNIVQGNIVAPLVYSRSISLHPAVVLMATPAGAAIAGMLGMFLVVPVVGIVAATWRTVLHLFDPDDVAAPVPISAPGAPPPEPVADVSPAPAPG